MSNKRIGLARAVAHLAQAVDALVRVDANERARHRRARHHGDAQVGDLQVRRFGIGVGVLRQRVQGLIGPEAGAKTRRQRRG